MAVIKVSTSVISVDIGQVEKCGDQSTYTFVIRPTLGSSSGS